MADARIAAGVEASGFIRIIEAQGGHGTILRKGDADRGALLLVVTERGAHQACLVRSLSPQGRYAWNRVGPGDEGPGKLEEFLARRHRSDPDEWQIELDVPSAERFIAETITSG